MEDLVYVFSIAEKIDKRRNRCPQLWNAIFAFIRIDRGISHITNRVVVFSRNQEGKDIEGARDGVRP